MGDDGKGGPRNMVAAAQAAGLSLADYHRKLIETDRARAVPSQVKVLVLPTSTGAHAGEIGFGGGAFGQRPAPGGQVMAHEVTHVVQQGGKTGR